MSPSSFESALFEKHLIAFPPNVSFQGEPRNADGSDLSDDQLHWLAFVLEPVTSATQEIILPQPDRFRVRGSRIAPKTVITFSGMPNASARISGEGELKVHIGILFAFMSLPLTLHAIRELMTGPGVDVAALERFRPPPEVIGELDRLMDAWDRSAESGWRLATLPSTPDSRTDDSEATDEHVTVKGMTSILLGHELTHWFETIYKRGEWARMMKEVRERYRTWLRAEKQVSPEAIEEVEALLRRGDVLDNWVRETHADCGAYDFACASDTLGGWIRGPEAAPYVMEVNINMALFFSLLTLFEVWARLRGAVGDISTHPPASIRRAVFYHIQAKKLGMSQEDFLFRQFGAGTAIDYIMGRIIGEYMAVRG
jgi:hypothetical protein